MNIRPRLYDKPIRIGVGEELTNCIHCDIRTHWTGEVTDENELVEFCLECGQNYIVEEDEIA